MLDIALAVTIAFLLIFGIIERLMKHGDLLVEYAMIVGQSKLGSVFIFIWTGVMVLVVYLLDMGGMVFTANALVVYLGWSLWCMLSSPNLKC